MQEQTTGAVSAAPDTLETNEHGATQSKIDGAFHAIPPAALLEMASYLNGDYCVAALFWLGSVLADELSHIRTALECVYTAIYEQDTKSKVHSAPINAPLFRKILAHGLTRIAEVRAVGIVTYPFNNWRLISFRSHLDHAMRHLCEYLKGDRAEDHLGHAACRLVFALEVARVAGEPLEKFMPAPVPVISEPPVDRDRIDELPFGENDMARLRAWLKEPESEITQHTAELLKRDIPEDAFIQEINGSRVYPPKLVISNDGHEEISAMYHENWKKLVKQNESEIIQKAAEQLVDSCRKAVENSPSEEEEYKHAGAAFERLKREVGNDPNAAFAYLEDQRKNHSQNEREKELQLQKQGVFQQRVREDCRKNMYSTAIFNPEFDDDDAVNNAPIPPKTLVEPPKNGIAER